MVDELRMISDTAPELSGAAIMNLPRAWIRSAALATAATLATSGDWTAPYGPDLSALDRGLPFERSLEPGLLWVSSSPELEAIQVAVAANHGWWADLHDRVVPARDLVRAIERDLIRVRAIQYRNPAWLIAVMGPITAAVTAKLDAIVDPQGYAAQVRARHDAQAAQFETDRRKSVIEGALGGLGVQEYVAMRVAEGERVDEVVQQLQGRQRAESITLLAQAIYRTTDAPGVTPGLPVGFDPAGPVREITERLIESDADAQAIQALVVLEPTITAGTDTDPFFAPPA